MDPYELIEKVIEECPLAAKHVMVLCALLKRYGDDGEEAIRIVCEEDLKQKAKLEEAAMEMVDPTQMIPMDDEVFEQVKYTPPEQKEKESEQVEA